MRRWMAILLACAAISLTVASEAPNALAQDAPEEVSFDTADGVRLKGLFHRSAKGEKQGNAVVILLYPPGPSNSMLKPGDWAGLAKTLNDSGFHVFRFDWRGHGKSTDVTDTNLFWNAQTNPFTAPWNLKYIAGAHKKPLKSELNAKKNDFKPNYFPAYVTDLAAVRMYLDQKNDEGTVNCSSIYLIGAGDAATLGMLWMTSEWLRPAVAPVLAAGQTLKYIPTPGIIADPEAGRDVAGAVWLSASRAPMIRESTVAGWVSRISPKLRENNPMLFLYGQKDNQALSQAKYFYNEVLVAKGNKGQGVKDLEQTFMTSITNSALKGSALLGNNADLKTEDTILKYLAARQKDRVSKTSKKRMYVAPYFIDLRYFGLIPG